MMEVKSGEVRLRTRFITIVNRMRGLPRGENFISFDGSDGNCDGFDGFLSASVRFDDFYDGSQAYLTTSKRL